MGFYDINPVEFKLMTNQPDILDNFYKDKVTKIYSLYLNVYPSMTMQLFRGYWGGIEEFTKALNVVHSKVMDNLNKKLIQSSYILNDILLTILDVEKENNIVKQALAAKLAVSKSYDKLMKNTSSQIFYTDIFEGYIHEYGNLAFDSEALNGHCSRNPRKVANLAIFPLAKELVEYNFTYQYPVFESSVFLIRQSIEVHIKNNLGIVSIRQKKRNGRLGREIGIANILQYMEEKIKNKSMAINVDIKVIQLINKWVNTYIHTGRFSYPYWYISTILLYLNNFFYVPSEIKELYSSSYFNLESSIFAEKSYEEDMYNDIENYFIEKKGYNVKIEKSRSNNLIVVSEDEINSIQKYVKKSQEDEIQF
ncbi:hypothetical protein [Clostridium saccharobutylicum]|uniref:Uncharacterized protein n=1 Tax=Clostridium saccharobutylicum TaxID=169679 RepID=A0A1S8MYL1_CLOSA|nr:hypothetical protein [Clostridium saccharobutylicum]OOM09316.1 hypothetical protein CLOSAC_35970 [Clostridium saccharobutylicum]